MIILPPLTKAARDVLVAHDEEILKIFQSYALAFSQQMVTVDDILPLSGIRIGEIAETAELTPILQHLQETAIPIVVRSPFVANSGHDDSFKSVSALTGTSRAGLNLNHHAIPTMAGFTTIMDNPGSLEHQLNAYILDFYIHGQVSALEKANCIRRGDVWYLLQDFALTLLTVRAALLQILSHASQEDISSDSDQDLDTEDADEEVSSKADVATNKRPPGISKEDWEFLKIVDQVCEEFQTKFKAMWA